MPHRHGLFAGGFKVQVSPHIIKNYRSAYTLVDFFGYFGGLLVVSFFIGQVIFNILTFFVGDELDRFLLTSLFKYDNGTKVDE